MLDNHEPGNFLDLSDEYRLRCAIALGCSLFSFLLACPVFYVYFLHSDYRVNLRSHFNNLVVGCVMLQACQSLLRAACACLLLVSAISLNICNVIAALDSALDTSSLVLILGFYYSLMAVRVNPVRTLFFACCSCTSGASAWYETFRAYVWFVLALLVCLITAGGTLLQVDRYGIAFGWCTPIGSPAIFLITLMCPLLLIVSTSIATMLVLRCCVGDDGRGIVQKLTWARHWTIYVRFFGVIMFVVTALVATVAMHFAMNGHETHTLLPSVLLGLWPALLSFTFLLTEGILHHWCRRIRQRCCCCCSEDASGADFLTSRGSAAVLASQSLAHLARSAPREGGVESVLSDDTDYDAASPLPQRSTLANLHNAATRDSLQPPRVSSSGINGFTTAIHSLLSMEVIGVTRLQSDQRGLENDRLLGCGAGGGRADTSTVYSDYSAMDYGAPRRARSSSPTTRVPPMRALPTELDAAT